MHTVKVALYVLLAVSYWLHLPYIVPLYFALAACELLT